MSVPKYLARPTVVSVKNFNADNDAEIIREAMKGLGCRDDVLIKVLANRCNKQRVEIATVFKTKYGKDLIDSIKSETSGNFKDLLIAMCKPTFEFYVEQIHDAMDGLGTDADCLIEFLVGLSNKAIDAINTIYKARYNRTLEQDIISDTSGSFRRLLVSLTVGGRDESSNVDKREACADAQALLDAGELKVGTDESKFNEILCRRSFRQLVEINRQYEQLKGHGLEEAIENEFSGDIRKGLKSIIRCALNRQEFFATRLHKSMAGIGTNDQQLIRLIVVRSELDLADIKDHFCEKYGKSLKEWIKGDTSGSYRKCLFTLIGEPDEEN